MLLPRRRGRVSHWVDRVPGGSTYSLTWAGYAATDTRLTAECQPILATS